MRRLQSDTTFIATIRNRSVSRYNTADAHDHETCCNAGRHFSIFITQIQQSLISAANLYLGVCVTLFEVLGQYFRNNQALAGSSGHPGLRPAYRFSE
jgi:hypothetical protein